LILSKSDDAFRDEVRTHFDARIPTAMREASKLMTSVYAKRDVMDLWQRTLHEKGWGTPMWPLEYGGCDWSPAQHFIFAEEKAHTGAPPYLSLGAVMCGAVIIKFGTQEQKRHFLPRMASGEDYWCQGYSEPGSGSDLAALSLRAEEDGRDLVLNGSKIWTSHAHEADWMYALVRSTSGSRQQNGITFLLVDMRTPGIEVRPIVFLTGEHIQNEVVFRDVRVPLANVVGELNQGWTVAKYLMEFERGGQLWSPEHQMKLDGIAAFAQKSGVCDAAFIARLAAARIDLMTFRALEWREMSARSGSPGVGSSMLKMLGTELSQRITELALEAGRYHAMAYQPGLTTPGGNTPWAVETLAPPVVSAEAAAYALRYFNDRAGSIYAGSNEIQRNILAKRQLGL
jgi:alkylation response protein AidB-like acyl-CoA dehydrogenase